MFGRAVASIVCYSVIAVLWTAGKTINAIFKVAGLFGLRL